MGPWRAEQEKAEETHVNAARQPVHREDEVELKLVVARLQPAGAAQDHLVAEEQGVAVSEVGRRRGRCFGLSRSVWGERRCGRDAGVLEDAHEPS